MPKPNDHLDDKNFSIIISREDLKESWEPGSLYKIQVRFGGNELWNMSDQKTFSDWKKK